MQKAIDFGLRNSTVGVIITNGDKIIVKTGGTIYSDSHDATGHSEIVAIRKACKKLGTNRLNECWIYSTYEPCPMCMSAICWARMKGVVYAASQNDRNEKWKQMILIQARNIIEKSEYKPTLIEEFMREEAKEILKY